MRNVGIKGGPAHCRAYLPHLLDLQKTTSLDLGDGIIATTYVPTSRSQ